MPSHRHHPAYVAFLIHRLSGVGLALFLPLHFLTLGLALEGAEQLDGFLAWADQPLVKLSELGLVVLLAGHLAGGLRLLALEMIGWTPRQNVLIALGFAFSLMIGLAFALSISA